VAVVVATGAILAGGCGKSGGDGAVRVANFMTDPVLIKILTETAAQAEKENPGLKIRVESIPYSNYQEKVLTQVTAGNAPDVVFVEVNNFVSLHSRDVFEDLTPYVQRDGLSLKDYYPGLVARFSRDGKLYALPQDTAPTGLIYYNQKAFREAGLPEPKEDWSWPEPFLSICKRLVKKDAAGRVTRFAYSEAYPIQIHNFAWSNGADWVDDASAPTRLTVDTPAFLEAARFRFDLIHRHRVAPDPTQLMSFNAAAGVEHLFSHGQIAMISSGIWHTPQLLENKDLEFDVVPFPRGPKGLRGWGTGGSGYAISRSSKRKDEAWKVIRALLSESSVRRMAATGFMQPALIPVAESDVFLKAPGPSRKKVLLKMPQYAHYEPFDPDWGEIYYGTINPALDPVWLGEKQPEPVLRDVAQRVNRKFYPKK
jgi:ABC-type glycerol-3-phosphate transport system substrate-binding protein